MIDAVSGLFLQLGGVVVIAAFFAYVLKLLKQPQILAYVLVGILLTPILGIVTDTTIIDAMSLIGVAFLLFIVGLEMDVKALKSVALVSTFGAFLQMLTMFTIGFFLALALGWSSLTAIVIGFTLAFSSTMVVMKLLSDQKTLQTLHGRIVTGTLLTQDIIAIFALLMFSAIGDFAFNSIGFALLKFIILVALIFVVAKYLFPKIFKFAAKNRELLLITSVGVCFAFAIIFHYLEFSLAIGAFVAGVALGNLEYDYEIIGAVKSLKDFFTLLFFVSLGMTVQLGVVLTHTIPFLLLFLAILFVKPIVILIVCSLFKFTKKPAFMVANSLAQVGEFSLILATQALALKHISKDIYSLIVLVMLVSITLTSYYIKHAEFFFKILSGPLKLLNRFTTEGLEYAPTNKKPKIVLCGHNRIGYSILKRLKKSKKDLLVVDYNPEIIATLADEGYHCLYGDIGDHEIVDHMNLPGVRLLISTIPSLKITSNLIKKTRLTNKKARIIVTANSVPDALKFYKLGADYVLLPHFLGGEHVAELISAVRSRKVKLKEEREDHIEHLKDRKSLGHKHPLHH